MISDIKSYNMVATKSWHYNILVTYFTWHLWYSAVNLPDYTYQLAVFHWHCNQ